MATGGCLYSCGLRRFLAWCCSLSVSDEGVRTGNLHFVEWSRLDHVVQSGSRFDLFHEVNPNLPFSCVRLKNSDARQIFLERLAKHHVRFAEAPLGILRVVRFLVAAVALAELAGGRLFLQSHAAANPLSAVVLVFVAGLLATMLLERYRGIVAVTQLKPLLEAEQNLSIGRDA